MALVENDDASSFIDPSAENLASPGLAEQAQLPPYAASPSPTGWLFNHGGLTWNPVKESEMSEEGETTIVVHHLQRDSDNHSVNTECDSLVDMAGGMVMSPLFMGFSGDEPLYLMPEMVGGTMMGTSPTRMTGNSDPFTLCNFADDSEVQELGNSKGMMMRPTCIEEVDAGQNQSLGIREAENMGGTVQTSDEWFQLMNYSLPSDDPLPIGLGGSYDLYRLWDDVDYRAVHELYKRERIVKTTLSLILVNSIHRPLEVLLNIAVQTMEKGLLVAHTDTQFKLNTPTFSLTEVEAGNEQPIIGRLIMASGELPHRNSLERQLIDNLERHAAESEKSVNLDRLAVELKTSVIVASLVAALEKFVNLEWFAAEFETSGSFLPLLDARCWRIPQDSPWEGHIPKSSATNKGRNNVVVIDAKGRNRSSYKIHSISRWEKDHGITRQLLHKSRDDIAETLKVSISTFKRACHSLEEVGTASEENHTAHIWHAAGGRGGMLLQQEDSSSEPHIPESSPTNEETNNVVELNNSIDDAKGGNSSSEKTNTTSRWEKDYGITHQALQQLFGKSRDDAAKTLDQLEPSSRSPENPNDLL